MKDFLKNLYLQQEYLRYGVSRVETTFMYVFLEISLFRVPGRNDVHFVTQGRWLVRPFVT